MNNHDQAAQLNALARRELETAGFEVSFSPEEIAEANRFAAFSPSAANDDKVKNLRGLLWSSIDNRDTRDLDQVEYCEAISEDRIRVMVAIADVASVVPKDSALDRRAAKNCVSVYTPAAVFPMLPEVLSTGATSLLQDQDRLAFVTEIVIGPDSTVQSYDVYRALVTNRARLSYESLTDWLEGGASPPAEVSQIGGLQQQIELQRSALDRLRSIRNKAGALEFDSVETVPVISDSRVTAINFKHRTVASALIENFMIAVNVQVAEFLESHDIPSLRRIVREPERWPRIVELAASSGFQLPEQPDPKALSTFMEQRAAADPSHYAELSIAIMKLMGPGEYAVEYPGRETEGHFGLAVHDYTHSTAPNRRFPDLVTQRQIAAWLSGAPAPYQVGDLENIAEHCTRTEDAARKVERQVRKSAVALWLSDRIGQTFDAIVTGVKPHATFARLLNPVADGMIVNPNPSLDVGEHVRVRLVSTDPARGFIDFKVVNP